MNVGNPGPARQAATLNRAGRSGWASRWQRSLHLWALALPLCLAACGGGGGGGSAGNGTGTDSGTVTPISRFAGLVLATANSPSSATLAWQEASGGSTPAAQLRYALHVSTTDGFTPAAATLAQTVTGTTRATLTGLQADTVYHVQVVALDSAGRATTSSGPALTLHTPAQAPVLSASTPLLAASDLKLPAPRRSGDSLTFAWTGAGTLPPVGAVLVGNDADGAPYLLTVQQATVLGSSLSVQGIQAQLGDAVLSGELGSQSVLFASPTTAAGSGASGLNQAQAQTLGTGESSGPRLSWPGDLLRFEERAPTTLPAGTVVRRDAATGRYQLVARQLQRSASTGTSGGLVQRQSLTGSASDEMNFDIGLDFAPQLTTRAVWSTGLSGLVLKDAELAATGTLTLDAKALYKFAASGRYSTTQALDVFTRRYTSTYLMGTVPVLQEVVFTLVADVQAEASSAIDASADAQLVQSVSFGVRYNAATESWEPYSSVPGASSSLTASFALKGGAKATLTLQPKVEVRFYSLVSGSLSLQPTVGSAIAAEAVRNLDLLAAQYPPGTTQLTTFDVNAGAKCYVGASLEFLSRRIKLMSPTQICTVPEVTLFSLPKLALAVTQQPGYTALQADITDGVRNAFNDASIRWTVAPASAGSIAGGTQRQALFQFADGARSATVFFSGTGVLGEVGRQFQQVTLQAPPATTTAPSAVVDELSTTGSVTLGVTVDADGTGYWLVTDASSGTEPTAAELPAKGQAVALSAGVPATLVLSGLSGGHGYQARFIAASPTGNLQRNVQQLNFVMPLRYLSAAGLVWAPPDRVNAVPGGLALLATDHAEAEALCAAGRWRGLAGWRLPTLAELRALAAAPLGAAGWTSIRLWAAEASTVTGDDGTAYAANPGLAILADASTASFNAVRGTAALSSCVHP